MIWIITLAVALPVTWKLRLYKNKEDIASFCERKHAELFARRLLSRKVVRFTQNLDTMASINLADCCRKVRAQDLEYYCTHLVKEMKESEEDPLAQRNTAKSFRCMLCCIKQYAKQGMFRDDYETIRPTLSQANQICDRMLGKESRCLFQCFSKI